MEEKKTGQKLENEEINAALGEQSAVKDEVLQSAPLIVKEEENVDKALEEYRISHAEEERDNGRQVPEQPLKEQKEGKAAQDTSLLSNGQKSSQAAAPVKKHKHVFKTKSFLQTALSALARAVGVQLFLIPNSIILGGAIGISSILEITVGQEFFSACYWLVIINAPLLILAYFKIGKNWAMRTAVNVLLTALFMWVIRFTNLAEILDTTNSQYKVLYAIIGGVLSGIALPTMFNVHGSTGGSDIIALMIRDKAKGSSRVMRMILYMDIAVSAAGATILWNFEVFVFSIIALLASEVAGELIYRGYSSALVLEIVTEKPEEVSRALMEQLKHGVSNIRIKGAYTNTEKTMVLCVIFKRQVVTARRIIRTIDQTAFAYILNVKEVVGRGFKNTEEEFEKYN